MPELPEVETIVRSLRNAVDLAFSNSPTLKDRPGVVRRKIADVEVNWERSIAEPDVVSFYRRIHGQTILDVQRRGKFIVFQLDDDCLLIHLRMSGDIRVESRINNPLLPHDRVVFNFTDDARMVFNDTRKFGRVWLVADACSVLERLGPEPLSPDLSTAGFHQALQRHKRAIKPILLDQGFVAGMGNIYTDEALHLARIHPLEKASSLNYERAEDLLKAIRSVLEEGIRRNGASIDWVYRGGDFQNYFRVYQRTGDACKVCGTKIERIVVGQRGTHFCPTCQPPEIDR